MERKTEKIILLCLCLMLLALSLCGCGGVKKSYAPQDYILETEYKPDYRILQLSDVHLANKDNRQLHYDFMDLIVDDADPDLIVVTGDLFTFADKTVAREFFDWLDSHGVPWTVTFGNHDEQCYFSVDWMTGVLNEYGSNCLFKDLQDDDVFGNSNFAINLMDGEQIKYQVILLDSNRYNYGEYWGYDYIKQDQLLWYEKLVSYTAEQNGGSVVPSVMYFHIPLPEINDAWEALENGDPDAELIFGEKTEKFTPPEYNSGMFDMILKLGSTKAISFGHDHLNNLALSYKGVVMSFGLTSTDRIYYDPERMGGQVISIAEDGSLSFERFLHSYDELADEDAKR